MLSTEKKVVPSLAQRSDRQFSAGRTTRVTRTPRAAGPGDRVQIETLLGTTTLGNKIGLVVDVLPTGEVAISTTRQGKGQRTPQIIHSHKFIDETLAESIATEIPRMP